MDSRVHKKIREKYLGAYPEAFLLTPLSFFFFLTQEVMSMIVGHCQIGMFLDDAVYILRNKLGKDPSIAMDVLDSLFFDGLTQPDSRRETDSK